MKNLLQETLQVLKEINKTPDDILWIGSVDGEYSCTWKKFKQLADKEYDEEYEAPEVAYDLVIVFKDNTYLERDEIRHEYNGLAWWSYKKCPILKPNPKSINELIDREIRWSSLEEINNNP